MSSIVNKVKDTLGSNNNNTHSTTTHEQQQHAATTGAPGTHTENVKTGPVHHNETLNKVDPRVHEHKTTTTTGTATGTGAPVIDPTNASHVPPSVMQQHVGEPSIEHDFPHDSKHKRHSVSHQENHLMK